jgi:hypothetical protein
MVPFIDFLEYLRLCLLWASSSHVFLLVKSAALAASSRKGEMAADCKTIFILYLHSASFVAANKGKGPEP